MIQWPDQVSLAKAFDAGVESISGRDALHLADFGAIGLELRQDTTVTGRPRVSLLGAQVMPQPKAISLPFAEGIGETPQEASAQLSALLSGSHALVVNSWGGEKYRREFLLPPKIAE